MKINNELFNAVSLNDRELTKALILKGIALDNEDRYGRTILFEAVLKNFYEMVDLLCSNHANVNHKDHDGKTPLHFAVQEQLKLIAELLINYGADVNAQDSNGNSIVSDAVFHSKGNGEIINLLRAKGADIYLENDYGISALSLAESIDNYDIAKFLK